GAPNDGEGRLTNVKFTWLKENFQHLLSSPTQMDIIYAAKAFILQLIGGILLLDINQNKVPIMYLPLLEDLELARRFSWGSAVLACLYCELCQVTKPSAKIMGSCCLLLYILFFAWKKLSDIFIHFFRWATIPGTRRSFMVPMYRMMIETYSGDGFIWMLYVKENIAALIPAWVIMQQQLFMSNVPLINLHMVEWHDRESDAASNPDLELQYEAFGSLSHHPEPEQQIPPSFEDIFGNNLDPQHSTRSRSSSYHLEFDHEAHTPTIEDIFPLAPSITQYPLTLDYGIYDYSTFLSTPERTLEVGLSKYQTSQQSEQHRRRRRPDRYTPTPGTSPRS
ncbi:hypothetical protein J1N35_005913, partial [Gossypium stocksii]